MASFALFLYEVDHLSGIGAACSSSPSVDWHLDWFHVMDIVNNSAINILSIWKSFLYTNHNSPSLSSCPSPPPPDPLHPVLRKSKTSHEESAKPDIFSWGRTTVPSPPHQGWTRHPPYRIGFKKPVHARGTDPGHTARCPTSRPDSKTVAHMQRTWLHPMQEPQVLV